MSFDLKDVTEGTKLAGTRFAFAAGARPIDGYTLGQPLGMGGFGEVYAATSDAGKHVALKLIRRNLEIELRGITHCLNLKHPHLVALHDVRYDRDENCWVVMEQVRGPSLEAALATHKHGLPVDEALGWFRGMVAGVAYLHSQNVVHRDLKPGNAFNDDGIIKLGDYGLSKFMRASARSQQTESIGTVHYMAPEISHGRYGHEIDQYALGVILYEMLTGRVPFEGESVGEVLMKHLTATPDVSRLPERFRAAVAQSLAKDPQARHADVTAMLREIDPAMGDTLARVSYVPAMPLSATRTTLVNRPSGGTLADEPVWKFTAQRVRQVVRLYQDTRLSTVTKVLGLIMLVVLVARNASWIVPLLIWLSALYGIYFVVRYAWYWAYATTTKRVADAALAKLAREAKRAAWLAEPTSVAKRVGEWVAALGIAVVAVMASSAVLLVLRGKPVFVEQFWWLVLVGIAGSWGIVTASKLWERRPEEPLLQRLVMLVIGLATGTWAAVLQEGITKEAASRQLFDVLLPYDMVIRPLNEGRIPKSFYDAASNAPLLPAFLGYFGFLFLLTRFYKLAEPTRTTRLNVLASLRTLFAAWILNFVWPFPQPWGFMVTLSIALAVQLASPWWREEPLATDIKTTVTHG